MLGRLPMLTLEILLFHQIWSPYCLLQTDRLFRHQRVSLLLFFNLLIVQPVFFLSFSWELRNSFRFSKHLHPCTFVGLSEIWLVRSRFWIDVMREKIVSINRASVNWICIAHAICVPCWFSIEGCEG